jgi:folate-dependent phosphoribosylglycinamide formyltransferase PurN
MQRKSNDQGLPLKVAVGVSGGGRTLSNLLSHQSHSSGYEVIGVFSSNSESPGLALAESLGLATLFDPFAKAAQIDRSGAHPIYSWLDMIGANFVALAGFLRPFPINQSWDKRVINIHPSLLPKFGGKGMYGLAVHQAVIASNESQSGATIHFVTEEYDQGAIISQASVPVTPDDTAESLAAKVFAAECQLYPQVLRQLAKQHQSASGLGGTNTSFTQP